jgi:hypothetical protein
MNFKQFFESRKSGAHHLSPTAIHSGGLHKTSGSVSLVADHIKKKQRENKKVKRAQNNKGVKVAIASHQLHKLKSSGKKINLNKIGSKGKTLNGKTGVKIKKGKNGFYLEK